MPYFKSDGVVLYICARVGWKRPWRCLLGMMELWYLYFYLYTRWLESLSLLGYWARGGRPTSRGRGWVGVEGCTYWGDWCIMSIRWNEGFFVITLLDDFSGWWCWWDGGWELYDETWGPFSSCCLYRHQCVGLTIEKISLVCGVHASSIHLELKEMLVNLVLLDAIRFIRFQPH